MARMREYTRGFDAPPTMPYDMRAGRKMAGQIRDLEEYQTERAERISRRRRSPVDSNKKMNRQLDLYLANAAALTTPGEQGEKDLYSNRNPFARERLYIDSSIPGIVVHEKRGFRTGTTTRTFYAMTVPSAEEQANGVQPRRYICKITQDRGSKSIERSFDERGSLLRKTKTRSNGRYSETFVRSGNRLIRTEFTTSRWRDGNFRRAYSETMSDVDNHGKRRIVTSNGKRGKTFERDEGSGEVTQIGHIGRFSSIVVEKSGTTSRTTIKRLGSEKTFRSHLNANGDALDSELIRKRGLISRLNVTLNEDGSIGNVSQRDKFGRKTEITFLPGPANPGQEFKTIKKSSLWRLSSIKTDRLTTGEQDAQQRRKDATRNASAITGVMSPNGHQASPAFAHADVPPSLPGIPAASMASAAVANSYSPSQVAAAQLGPTQTNESNSASGGLPPPPPPTSANTMASLPATVGPAVANRPLPAAVALPAAARPNGSNSTSAALTPPPPVPANTLASLLATVGGEGRQATPAPVSAASAALTPPPPVPANTLASLLATVGGNGRQATSAPVSATTSQASAHDMASLASLALAPRQTNSAGDRSFRDRDRTSVSR